MTTQTVPSNRRWFSKAWLLEQKSLIALIVLIAVVASQSPNFFLLWPICSTFFSRHRSMPSWLWE